MLWGTGMLAAFLLMGGMWSAMSMTDDEQLGWKPVNEAMSELLQQGQGGEGAGGQPKAASPAEVPAGSGQAGSQPADPSAGNPGVPANGGANTEQPTGGEAKDGAAAPPVPGQQAGLPGNVQPAVGQVQDGQQPTGQPQVTQPPAGQSQGSQQPTGQPPAGQPASSPQQQAGPPSAGQPSMEAPASSRADDGKINLNTATAEQLDALPGIGESRAKAILEVRERLGGRFTRVEQLLEVKGIGEKMLEKIRPHVTLD